MKALLQKVFESFQEDFGHPVKLIRLLQEHPDICVSLDTPAPCIDAYSVAPWRDYEMFVISDATPIRRGFHDAMEAFRATWLGHSMPRPFQNTQAILLPKAERRSMQVATLRTPQQRSSRVDSLSSG